MYCATTLSCGCWSSGGPPLVVDMNFSPDTLNYFARRLANMVSPGEQGDALSSGYGHLLGDRAAPGRARVAIVPARDRPRRRCAPAGGAAKIMCRRAPIEPERRL